MKKEDWVAAGVLAAAVALAVVAAGLPPTGWAEDSARVTIPALPPAELKIPSLDATVTAVAERKPDEAVTVRLSCECSAGHSRQTVPLVIHVFKNDPRRMMSRVAEPTPPPEVAKVECSCPIDSEGKGFTSVELPLTWTSDDSPKPEKGKPVASYYLLLTSPLTRAQATLPSPEEAVQANQQQAK
jgi:hypothetical protein